MQEGVLLCSNPGCQCEYPIIDGIPLLLPDIRAWVADNVAHVLSRTDLADVTESILGDCCGHGSWFDSTRQHLSSYAWDHYGDSDPDEADEDPRPGSILRLLHEGLDAANPASGPVLDVGCSVGGTSFAVAAQSNELVLGVDLSYPMLRTASHVLGSGTVSYPRRRVGVVYDRREFAVDLPGADRVDFWACDACALPFRPQTFGLTVGMNVLDCLQSPLEYLNSMTHILRSGGQTVIATPYDWSGGVTPMEAWIGGHSQRGPQDGESDTVLQMLLGSGQHPASISGLKIVAERDNLPWRVRMHDRSAVDYRVHLIVAQAE